MLGRGHLWPPVAQWLDPGLDERLLATAVHELEEEAAR